jgi:hypothetical protein
MAHPVGFPLVEVPPSTTDGSFQRAATSSGVRKVSSTAGADQGSFSCSGAAGAVAATFGKKRELASGFLAC